MYTVVSHLHHSGISTAQKVGVTVATMNVGMLTESHSPLTARKSGPQNKLL